MSPDFTLFVVDDNLATRRVLQGVLAKSYLVEAFDSGAGCIDRLSHKIPDMFLLDVDMPQMNGYELCQHLKGQVATRDVPVIFVSGYDDLESRLKGYEVGGDDFIVKPYKPADLLTKVGEAERAVRQRRSMTGQAVETALKASGVLSQLEEMTVLVKFLSVLNSCNGARDIAATVLALLKAYRLEGGLQIRQGATVLTTGHQGDDRPLEIAVFSRIKEMGPLVRFKTHAAFNYPCISVAVSNMPLEAADLCERLVGHLTLATQAAHVKLQSIVRPAEADPSAIGVRKDTLVKVRADVSAALSAMRHELDEASSYLGLTDEQEVRITAIVNRCAEDVISAFG